METKDIDKRQPDPWVPVTEPQQVAIIGKGIEEGSEYTGILARILIQGIDGLNPETGKSNRQALSEEVGDNLAQLERLIQYYGLQRDVINARSRKKFNFLGRWLVTLGANHDGWFDIKHIGMPRGVLERSDTITLYVVPLPGVRNKQPFAIPCCRYKGKYGDTLATINNIDNWDAPIFQGQAQLAKTLYSITHWRHDQQMPRVSGPTKFVAAPRTMVRA